MFQRYITCPTFKMAVVNALFTRAAIEDTDNMSSVLFLEIWEF